MNTQDIRRTAIIAMFSDDVLMEHLVLKGGNAIDLVHGLTARASLDIDFSMAADFADLDEIRTRIFRALKDRFDSSGMVVFDETFAKKPTELREGQDERWGGYRVEFKVVRREVWAQHFEDIEGLRRNASVLGAKQERVFRIEISKYEYCEAKAQAEFDDYTIYVYTPAMIVAEKIRAICQQMPEYQPVRNKRARARDFYDLHTVITRAEVNLSAPEFHRLVDAVFEAKRVPLALIGHIPAVREFHSVDWPAVLLALNEPAQSFDYYFDYVVKQVNQLKPLWNV